MPIEDNSRAKSDKQYFESSPKVDILPDIRDAEIVTGKNEQRIGACLRPEILRRIEELRKMPIEDSSRAKSDKQQFKSSPKVEKFPDIRNAEGYGERYWQIVTTKNVQRIGGCIRPKVRRRIEEMRKKNTEIVSTQKNTKILSSSDAVRRGPPPADIGGIICPKIRQKIERLIKNAESITVPKIPTKVDLYRRPKRKGEKRKKKSSALSDGKKDKKVT